MDRPEVPSRCCRCSCWSAGWPGSAAGSSPRRLPARAMPLGLAIIFQAIMVGLWLLLAQLPLLFGSDRLFQGTTPSAIVCLLIPFVIAQRRFTRVDRRRIAAPKKPEARRQELAYVSVADLAAKSGGRMDDARDGVRRDDRAADRPVDANLARVWDCSSASSPASACLAVDRAGEAYRFSAIAECHLAASGS